MIDTLVQTGRRAKLVKELQKKFAYDSQVLEAIGAVPRHIFIDAGLEHLAYEDMPLPIAAKQTISQPSTVAFQTHLLGLKKWDKVLEIGTGCGYQTAILARMGLRVYSIERQKELYLISQRNLAKLGFDRLIIVLGDGFNGLPKFAPFKGIIVTCAAEQIPQQLLLQLEIGGRMVIPLGNAQDGQVLNVITRKSEREFERASYGECSFVPMLEGINR